MVKKLFISVLLISSISQFYNTLKASSRVDSLKAVLKTQGQTKSRANTLNCLANDLLNDNPKEGELFAKESFDLSQKIGYQIGLANAANNLGIIYEERGEYEVALDYYNTSLKISEIFGDSSALARAYSNIGIIYKNKADYSKALEYYLNGLKIQERINDRSSMAISYYNIAYIYQEQKRYEEATSGYENALKIDRELNDKFGMAYDLVSIGNVYSEKGNYKKALDYNQQGLKLRQEIGDKKEIARSFGSMGELYSKMGDFGQAKENLFHALEIYYTLNYQQGIGLTLVDLAELSLKFGDYTKAKKHGKECLEIAIERNLKNQIKRAYNVLSEANEKQGDNARALQYYKLFTAFKDSILNVESNEKLAELETAFEADKRKKEIQLLNKDKELQAARLSRQEIELWAAVLGFLIVVIFSISLFNRYKLTQKQKAIIEDQKALVELTNQEMRDSINYAQRIQEATLTTDEYWNEIFTDHFLLFKPKDIVSGDFFWAYKVSDELAVWAAVDCTGHGVPGAFMSMIGNSLLHEIVTENQITNSDEILNELRAGIIRSLHQSGQEGEQKDGMDLALCVLNKKTKKLQFSGANNPLWIIRNGELMETKGDKQAIEFSNDLPPFTRHEFDLQEGDCLYTFSDGYADQFGGPGGKKLKYRPFKKLILDNHILPMKEQRNLLQTYIEEWKGELEQIDDICVIGVKI